MATATESSNTMGIFGNEEEDKAKADQAVADQAAADAAEADAAAAAPEGSAAEAAQAAEANKPAETAALDNAAAENAGTDVAGAKQESELGEDVYFEGRKVLKFAEDQGNCPHGFVRCDMSDATTVDVPRELFGDADFSEVDGDKEGSEDKAE